MQRCNEKDFPKESVLVFAPYSISEMDCAPRVRAYNLFNALKRRTYTQLLSGSSPSRAFLEIKNMLKKIVAKCVYIEALASHLNFVDYRFLNFVKQKNVPLFSFVRDLYWMFPDTRLKTTLGRRWWYRSMKNEMRWYLENASALFFPTKSMGDLFDFPEKYLLPPAGDPAHFYKNPLPQERNVVFVGGVAKESGVTALLEAMEIVRKEYDDANCIIVGQRARGDKRALNEWLNKKWVEFRNGNYFTVPLFLSHAFIAVIPWEINPYSEITMPYKLFDYMSASRPVLATDCREMANFIKKNEVGIVSGDSPESIASGILQLLDNPTKAEKLGKNGRKLIETKHSWHHRAEQLLNITEKF